MSAWTHRIEPGPALFLLIALLVPQAIAAPFEQQQQQDTTDIEYYPVADSTGCYYNFQHYDEGDRIITNEPCLNCTCHNRMLMCYLRVCPFTKAIGQDCKVEKRSDQCCPVITCPEVPVQLLPSTTQSSTAVGHLDAYGCSIDGLFYTDGARVPSEPNKPCELCYCIRNKTACVMQQCTLEVEGCKPVYQEGVCCPVRYNCEHPDYNLLETTTRRLITTTAAPTTTLAGPVDCIYNNEVYADGALIVSDKRCERCYCMKGDIVCAVQKCNPTPLDKVNCTALPPKEDQCCPDSYECEHMVEEELTTGYLYTTPSSARLDEPTTIQPGIESKPEEEVGVTSSVPEDENEIPQDGESTAPTTGKEGEVVQEPVVTVTPSFTDKEYPQEPSEGAITPHYDEGHATESTAKETEKPIEQEQGTEHPEEPQVPDEEFNEIPEEHEIVTAGPHVPAHDDFEHPEEGEEPEEHEGGSGHGVVPESEVTELPLPHVTEGERTKEPSAGTEKPEEQATGVPQLPVTEAEGTVGTELPQKPETELPHEATEKPHHVPGEEGTELPEQHVTEPAAEEGERITELPQTPEGEQVTESGIQPEHVPAEEQPEHIPAEEHPEQVPAKEEPEHPATEEGAYVTKPTIEEQQTEHPQEQVTTEGEHPHVIQHVTEMVPEIGTGLPHEMEVITEGKHVQEPVTEEESEEGKLPEISQVPVTEEVEPSVTELPVEHVPKGEDEEGKGTEAVKEHGTEEPTEEGKVTEAPSGVEPSKPSHPEVESTEQPKSPVTEESERATDMPQEPVVSDESTQIPYEEEEEDKLTEMPPKDIVHTTQIPQQHVTEGEGVATESPKDYTTQVSELPTDHVEGEKGTEVPEEHITSVPAVKDESTEMPKEGEGVSTEQPKQVATEGLLDERTELPQAQTEEGVKATELPKEHVTQPTEYEHVAPTELPKEQEDMEVHQDQVPETGEETEKPFEHITHKPPSESTELPQEHITEKETEKTVTELPHRPDYVTEVHEEASKVTEPPQSQVTLAEADEGRTTEVPQQTTQVLEEHPQEPQVVEQKPSEKPDYISEGKLDETTKYAEETSPVEGEIPEQYPVEHDHVPEGPEEETETPIAGETEKPEQDQAQTSAPSIDTETEKSQEPHGEEPTEEVVTEHEVYPSETSTKQGPVQEGEVTTVGYVPEKDAVTELPEKQSDGEQPTGPVTEAAMEQVPEQEDETTTMKYIPEKEGTILPGKPSEGKAPAPEVPTEEPVKEGEGTTVKSVPEQEGTEMPQQPVEGEVPAEHVPTKEGETTTELPQRPSEDKEHAAPTEHVPIQEEEGTTVKSTFETGLPEHPVEGVEPVESELTTTESVTHEQPEQPPVEPESPATEAVIEEEPRKEGTTHKYVPEEEETTGMPHRPQEEETETVTKGEMPSEEVTGEPKATELPQHVPSEEGPSATEKSPSEVTTSASTEADQLGGEVTEQAPHKPGIPGEGSCLVDGQTYKNNSDVPPINHCQVACKCMSSILQCESVTCTPPPSNLQHCMPVYHGPESCCPTYSCTVPGVTIMESDSHKMETTTTETAPGTIGVNVIIPSEEGTVRPEGTTGSGRDATELPEFGLPEEPVTKPQIPEELVPERGSELPPHLPEDQVTQITTGQPIKPVPGVTEAPATESEMSEITVPAVHVTEAGHGVEEETEQPEVETGKEGSTHKPVPEEEPELQATTEYPKDVIHDGGIEHEIPDDEENLIEDHTPPSHGISPTRLPESESATEVKIPTEVEGTTESRPEVPEHVPGEAVTESVASETEKGISSDVATTVPSGGVSEITTKTPSEPEGLTETPSEIPEGVTMGEEPEGVTEGKQETPVYIPGAETDEETEGAPESATESKQPSISEEPTTPESIDETSKGVTDASEVKKEKVTTVLPESGTEAVKEQEGEENVTEGVKEEIPSVTSGPSEPSLEGVTEHGEAVSTEIKTEAEASTESGTAATVKPVTEGVQEPIPHFDGEHHDEEEQAETTDKYKPEEHVTEPHIVTEAPETATSKSEVPIVTGKPEEPETEPAIIQAVTEVGATETMPPSVSHVTEKTEEGQIPEQDEGATHIPQIPEEGTEKAPSEEGKPSEHLPGEQPEVTTIREESAVSEEVGVSGVTKPSVHVPSESPTTVHPDEGITGRPLEGHEPSVTEREGEPSVSKEPEVTEKEGEYTTVRYAPTPDQPGQEGTTSAEELPESPEGAEKEGEHTTASYTPSEASPSVPEQDEEGEHTTPGSAPHGVPEEGELTTAGYEPHEGSSAIPEHIPEEGEHTTTGYEPHEGSSAVPEHSPEEGEHTTAGYEPHEGSSAVPEHTPEEGEHTTAGYEPHEGTPAAPEEGYEPHESSSPAAPQQVSEEGTTTGYEPPEVSSDAPKQVPEEGEHTTAGYEPHEGSTTVPEHIPEEGELTTVGYKPHEGSSPVPEGVPEEGEHTTSSYVPQEGATGVPEVPEHIPEGEGERTTSGHEGSTSVPQHVPEGPHEGNTYAPKDVPEDGEETTSAYVPPEASPVPEEGIVTVLPSEGETSEATEKEGEFTTPSVILPGGGTSVPEHIPEKEDTTASSGLVPEGSTPAENLPEVTETGKPSESTTPTSQETPKTNRPFVYIPPVIESLLPEQDETEKEGEHTTLEPEGATAAPEHEGPITTPGVTEEEAPGVTEGTPEVPAATAVAEPEVPEVTVAPVEHGEVTEPVVTITPVPAEQATEKVEGTEKGIPQSVTESTEPAKEGQEQATEMPQPPKEVSSEGQEPEKEHATVAYEGTQPPKEGQEPVTEQGGVTETPEDEEKQTETPPRKPEEGVSPVEVPTTIQPEGRPAIPGEGQEATVKPEAAFTSPTLASTPSSSTELYTSGPSEDESTKKSIPGELSTSAPSTPFTSSTTAQPPHDVPEEPDYHGQEEEEYDDDQSAFGPGTCRYGGKVYVSAQQIPRDDPCDFCFCFRSDIICLQQSCPPPIPRCHEEPIRGFCCPRYECPVSMATSVNVTTTTTTTTTTLPPHFFSHAYKGRAHRSGCQIQGRAYNVGEEIKSASGPCLHCTCGGNGQMKCDPKACSPEPMLRQMIAAAESRRRR